MELRQIIEELQASECASNKQLEIYLQCVEKKKKVHQEYQARKDELDRRLEKGFYFRLAKTTLYKKNEEEAWTKRCRKLANLDKKKDRAWKKYRELSLREELELRAERVL